MGAVASAADDGSYFAALLSTLQLNDSAFPSGRYTLSHGLESFAQSGRLHAPSPPEPLLALLSDSIHLSVAPSDGTALACAHRALSTDGTLKVPLLVRADERLTAVKLVRAPREASRRTGRALLDAAVAAFDRAAPRELAELVAAGRTCGNHAVVVGLLSASLGVSSGDAVAGELYAFAAGWVGAAVRLGLSDHLTAQALLHAAQAVIVESALQALGRDVEDISACAPMLDVMSMRHEQAEVRLFAT